jgi:Sec-independent protein secretion pathway component TatC
MLAMLIPLVVLYEISIHLSRLVQPKKTIVVQAGSADDDTPDDLGPAPA